MEESRSTSVLQGEVGPGQEHRPEEGEERRYLCFHEVSERIIMRGKFVREGRYGFLADNGRKRRVIP
jgi:hypothetical protein